MIQARSGAKRLLKDAKFNWGVAPLPLGPHAKGPGTLLITDSLAVFKGTGVEDKATEFAKFITSTGQPAEYDEARAGLTPLRPSARRSTSSSPRIRTGSRSSTASPIGGPEPLFTDYKGFQNAMIEMVQSVVTGKAEPADALKKAAADLEAVQVSRCRIAPPRPSRAAVGSPARACQDAARFAAGPTAETVCMGQLILTTFRNPSATLEVIKGVDLDVTRGRVRRLRRPLRLRQVHLAADDRRAGGRHRRRHRHRRQARSTTCRRSSAASPWCSSPTRSIRI